MRRIMLLIVTSALMVTACEEEETKFPHQIADITRTVGQFYSGLDQRDRARFDSAVTDPVLYDELVHVLGDDSLAVLTRRIYNPVDSAHIVMIVEAIARPDWASHGRYQLELFLHGEGGRFWIVGHKLTHYRR